LKAGCGELADGRVTFDDCYAAAVVLTYYFVEEGSVACVVGDTEEYLLAIVVAEVPAHAFCGLPQPYPAQKYLEGLVPLIFESALSFP